MNRYEQFKALHISGDMLLLPNAWDVPSALAFQKAGFGAIGTTSWAIAAMLGYKDGENIPFDEMLLVVKRIIAATDVMVTVDAEAGYADNEAGVVANIAKIANAGAVGINFEDTIKGAGGVLQPIEKQASVIRAIKNNVQTDGGPIFVNARIDSFLVIKDPIEACKSTIERGQAYAAAGADGIFVPFLTDEELIKEIVEASDVPVNVLALPQVSNIARLHSLGIRRLSLGNSVFDMVVKQDDQFAQQLKGCATLDMLFE